MCELLEKEILIIDCQTTAMHPKNGHLLQIGWCHFNPQDTDSPLVEKWTLKLPDDREIPNKIKKMLQISQSDLDRGVVPKKVFNRLQKIIKKLGPNPIVIAHYAQFEHSFLRQFYLDEGRADQLNFELICSQKIAKRLLPNIPSHNLKALSGYFKLENTPKNEVGSHVTMTVNVWRQLLSKLVALNIEGYEALATWLNAKNSKGKQVAFEYNIERFARLSLPEKPGIYRLLALDGSILYVGKATSLRARVNSYFRGTKNRDRRKLEMLAQAWSIETVECGTSLEASLLESDEIKKWSPPYNILLKENDRKVIFYNHTFTEHAEYRDSTYLYGPYRPNDSVSALIEFFEANNTQVPLSYLDEPITPEILSNAWCIFCDTYDLDPVEAAHRSIRKWFSIGHLLLRKFERLHGKGAFQIWWKGEKNKETDGNLTLEEKLSSKIWRLYIRAALEKRKSNQLRNMFNSSLIIKENKKRLTLVNGEIVCSGAKKSMAQDKAPLDIFHYDRLSILLSAKNKRLIFFDHTAPTKSAFE
jgi:DNA polymerase-3 subunit epsilon